MMPNFDDINFALPNKSQLPLDKLSSQDGKLSKHLSDGKPSVLIFGNDKEIRFLLRTILELWNYDSAEAENVEEALCIAERKSIDLVLMDTKWTYPESLVEMRVMQKFDLLKNSPFILLSGHVQNDVRLSAMAAGAADFFIKPLNLDLLEATIKKRTAKSGKRDL